MKTLQQRKIKVATFVLVLVFVVSTVCGCFTTVGDDGATVMNVAVNNITGQVNSLSEQYAVASEEVSAYDKDDLCWVVVRFNEESVLDRAMKVSPSDIYTYINSQEATNQADKLSSTHKLFAKNYSSVIKATSYRYTTLFSGIAVQIRYGDLAKLEKANGVQDVIVCERYYTPQDVTTNDVSVYETGIYDKGDVSYDGSGTIVAVLDTGLDYTHTAFQEQPYGELAVDIDKVRGLLSSFTATSMSAAKGIELTGDSLYVSNKVPFAYDYADNDADVYPTEDHGTHVAGIIAGHDERITGIATNAQLAIMKVFPNIEDTGAPTEGILAALNDCVVLGVDAINMSLGSGAGFSRLTDDEAVNSIYDKIRQAGICLLCAAGNEGSASQGSEKNGDMSLATNPDYGTVGSPSSYEAAMSVASISGVMTSYLMVNGDKEVYFTEIGTVNNVKRYFAKELLKGKTSEEYEYVVIPGLGTESNYYNLDVKDKIAVIKRGSINFEDKINTAQAKGAAGVIVYNNVSGTITMNVGKAQIPACSVSLEYGKYFEAHTEGKLVVNESYQAGPFMSDFSSWGPLPNLEFKPDITAHGGEILSAVRGGYSRISGTSMACPNMAGATILVRQYVKERFPDMAAYDVTELTYQLLMSTATIAYNEEGNPYSPRKQGAGLADIGKSTTASAYLYVEGTNKPKISLGDDPEKKGEYELVFNIRNLGAAPQSYTINPIVMTESLSADNKTVAQKAYMLDDTVYEASVEGSDATLSGKTLTVLGYGSAQITVKLTLSDAAKAYMDKTFTNGTFVEGYIELLSQNDDVNLNIGYLGFYGDWSVAPMLDVTAYQVGEEQDDPSILEDEKLQADVYATIPMAGFRYLVAQDEYEEAYFGMGEFGYYLADGYTKPATREDKAALTVDMEGNYSLKMIAAGFLRNAKTVHWQIVDAVTGELVANGVDYDINKSYVSGGRYPGSVMVEFNVNDYNLPNNGKYTFSMDCELDWASTAKNLNNTFSFDFYIDNEAPIVVEDRTIVRTEGTGNNRRYLLDVYAYDNHYVQGYQIGTYLSSNPDGSINGYKAFHNNIMPLPDGKRNTENKITYDITQYWDEIQANNGNIYLELIDYAKNTAEFQLKIPSSNADEIKWTSTMRQANVRVNEVIDMKDYLQMTPIGLWVKELKWWITDQVNAEGKDVAVVNDGVILGLNVGTATLHVSNSDGSSAITLPINVQAKRYDVINLSKIQLNKTYNEIERGEEFTLTATLVPYELFPEYKGMFAETNLVWTTSGGMARFVDPVTGELVDRVENASSVTVHSLRTGAALINVNDTLSPTHVNSNCTVYVKSEFEVEDGYLRRYTGRGDENGVVEIPNDLSIYYIYPYAFMNNPYITKIVFPEGMTQVMETAVYGCDNLEEVVLPSTCTTLSKWSFGWNPALKKVTFVRTIDENNTRTGVKSIGELAFVGCSSLTDIDFSGIYSIGPRAFAYCYALESIDLTNVKSMGAQAFAYCNGLTEIITGPDTAIGDSAFARCTGLTEITINSRLVGEDAFMFCESLQRVTFTNAVDTIDYGAFYGCEQLSQVNFRSTVRVIGDFAFTNCALETVVIPNGLESLGNLAFGFDGDTPAYGGPKEVIVLAGAKLTTIGAGIFQNCDNITEITVEQDNAYLSSNGGILYDKAQRKVLLVPSGYRTTEVTLPDSVTEIGDFAFAISAVETLNGANVTKIGNRAFDSSAITTVNFGQVSHIGDFAFFDTPKFKAWPECFNNVSYIGDFAFTAYTTTTTGINQGSITLDNVSHIGVYAFGYIDVTSVIINSDKLTEISQSAFEGCQKMTTIQLPTNSLRTIGAYAFQYCAALRTFVMPNSVTRVGDGAFEGCESLSNMTLSENITAISNYMFADCPALTRLNVPSSITYIGSYAFVVHSFDNYGNAVGYRQRSLNLTGNGLNNVTYIGDYAFLGVTMSAINAPSLVTVGNYAFNNSTVNTIYMPSVVTVGDYAFYNSSVSSITLDSVKYLGNYALANCKYLSGTLLLPSVVNLGAFALYGDAGINEVGFGPLETIGEQAFAATAISTLRLPATLKQIDTRGLYGALLLEQINISNNPTYFTDNGVLYKYLPNGLYSLVYYPVNVTSETYTANDKTVKVEAYAFAGATHLTHVILPERLQVLGAGAFYGCTRLNYVTLNSAAAPILEMLYDEANGGIFNHYYDTFETNTAEHKSSVTIRYPANGSGYDVYNWRMYFNANNNNVEVMTSISRTQTTIDTADTLEAMDINALTLDDISQIVLMRRIYASLSTDQQSFLSGVIGKLMQAEEQIARLLNMELATLPKRVTEADRAQIERLRSLYNSCNSEIQSQVSNLNRLTAAEAKLAALTGDGENNNSWMLPTFVSIGAVVVVAAAVVVTLLLLKRKKAQANNSNKEGEHNEK